jgi:hypothetical protein
VSEMVCCRSLMPIVDRADLAPIGGLRIARNKSLKLGKQRLSESSTGLVGGHGHKRVAELTSFVGKWGNGPLVVEPVKPTSRLAGHPDNVVRPSWWHRQRDAAASQEIPAKSANYTVETRALSGYAVPAMSEDRLDMEKAKADLAQAKSVLAEARLLSAYELLKKTSDLNNVMLDESERLTRAENLLSTYGRLTILKRGFRDTHEQLTAARRIQKAAYRKRRRAKLGLGAPVRGRPRKLHI